VHFLLNFGSGLQEGSVDTRERGREKVEKMVGALAVKKYRKRGTVNEPMTI
jgi:hypothetical protein